MPSVLIIKHIIIVSVASGNVISAPKLSFNHSLATTVFDADSTVNDERDGKCMFAA